MSSIQIFQNNQFGQIRVATNENGEPLFCLADVCRMLSLSNPSEVKRRLDDSDAQLIDLNALSLADPAPIVGNSMATFITEPGLYDVILRSDSPQAKPIRKWVTSEIMPSIRKHGGYLTPQKIEEALLNPDTIIKLATDLKEERAKRIKAEEKISAQLPAVTFTDAVIGSQSSCLIGELAKILRQNGIEIGEKRLFAWMRNNGYLGRYGERYNIPNQQYVEQGLFELKKGVRTGNSGVMHTTITSKVTGKGQVYFINKFLSKKSA